MTLYIVTLSTPNTKWLSDNFSVKGHTLLCQFACVTRRKRDAIAKAKKLCPLKGMQVHSVRTPQ